MKFITAMVCGLLLACSVKTENPTVKEILIDQLKNTYTNKDWFVPVNVAVEGLTSAQANWKDSTGNHSIAELVSHLVFWNERILIGFDGNETPDFNDDNEITFKIFDEGEWEQSVRKLDSIQNIWLQRVENATDDQLQEWSKSVANICSHNAYHTGQIVFIRKQNGWWNESMGVK
jgi:uncharacterized damage-inducible protein DinB